MGRVGVSPSQPYNKFGSLHISTVQTLSQTCLCLTCMMFVQADLFDLVGVYTYTASHVDACCCCLCVLYIAVVLGRNILHILQSAPIAVDEPSQRTLYRCLGGPLYGGPGRRWDEQRLTGGWSSQ